MHPLSALPYPSSLLPTAGSSSAAEQPYRDCFCSLAPVGPYSPHVRVKERKAHRPTQFLPCACCCPGQESCPCWVLWCAGPHQGPSSSGAWGAPGTPALMEVTQEEVIGSIRFNLIASLIPETSAFENDRCIHEILRIIEYSGLEGTLKL